MNLYIWQRADRQRLMTCNASFEMKSPKCYKVVWSIPFVINQHLYHDSLLSEMLCQPLQPRLPRSLSYKLRSSKPATFLIYELIHFDQPCQLLSPPPLFHLSSVPWQNPVSDKSIEQHYIQGDSLKIIFYVNFRNRQKSNRPHHQIFLIVPLLLQKSLNTRYKD